MLKNYSMKTNSNDLPVDKVFWPSNVIVPDGDSSHDNFISNISLMAVGLADRKPSSTMKAEYKKAARWLVFGLYQSHNSLPRSPLAIPLGWGEYGRQGVYGMKYGVKVLTNLIEVGSRLGYLSVQLGVFNPLGKGRITRLLPKGDLLDHFDGQVFQWIHLKPLAKNQSLFLNQGKHGKNRRSVQRHESVLVPSMQNNLHEINDFLSCQCIAVYASNSDLFSAKFWGKPTSNDHDLDALSLQEKTCSFNFQSIFLRRIFVQNSLQLGGRFYGGFWQLIPKGLRKRIVINGEQTVECDYSGLMFAMLYARVGLPLPMDPYDLEGITDTEAKRKLVKGCAFRLINSKTGRLKLTHKQKAVLGVSEKYLGELLRKKHQPIQRYFGSCVGVELQFEDSQLAEQIMLRLMAFGEPCLAIHDSFIVRLSQHQLLLKTMRDVFFEKYGQSIGIDLITGCDTTALDCPLDENNAFQVDFRGDHAQLDTASFSIIRGYIKSWRENRPDYIAVEPKPSCRRTPELPRHLMRVVNPVTTASSRNSSVLAAS